MSDSRPDWDHYFMLIATDVASRSDCRRSQVGAVIVDTKRRIVSTGYVGTRPGEPGCLEGACPRGRMPQDLIVPYTPYDNCISTHAETNALLYSDRSRHEGGTIYVTREPCSWDYKLILSSGLAFVKFRDELDIITRDLSTWNLPVEDPYSALLEYEEGQQ